MRGVGHLIAAKVLGHVGDVTRFPTADHFASYAGTSPLEASSGERRRHRGALEPLPPWSDARDCAGQMRATRPAWAAEMRATARAPRPKPGRATVAGQ
ncbi:transposase [Micromonospora sp. KC723]|uniref:transposase n=1 Tax=Micromonospora sp. KC723 TaxID=2530381 RepID=UPI00140553DC|nr:transposase [Micromonospora sp. KC723]